MDHASSGGGYNGQDNVTLTDATTRARIPWGDYAQAIHRWAAVLGRPAPPATELSPAGALRLSPRFVEWMMGLDEGWVTDPTIWVGFTDDKGKALAGTRLANAVWAAQLKALGNGVCPQQGAAGITGALDNVRPTA